MSKYRKSAIAAALATAAGMVFAQAGGTGGGASPSGPGPVQAPETSPRDPGAPAGTAGQQGPARAQTPDTTTAPGTTPSRQTPGTAGTTTSPSTTDTTRPGTTTGTDMRTDRQDMRTGGQAGMTAEEQRAARRDRN